MVNNTQMSFEIAFLGEFLGTVRTTKAFLTTAFVSQMRSQSTFMLVFSTTIGTFESTSSSEFFRYDSAHNCSYTNICQDD